MCFVCWVYTVKNIQMFYGGKNYKPSVTVEYLTCHLPDDICPFPRAIDAVAGYGGVLGTGLEAGRDGETTFRSPLSKPPL